MAHEPNPNDAYRDSDLYRATNPSRPIDNDEVIRDEGLGHTARLRPTRIGSQTCTGPLALSSVGGRRRAGAGEAGVVYIADGPRRIRRRDR